MKCTGVYCKCESCRYVVGLSWMKEEIMSRHIKLFELLKSTSPPVPTEVRKCHFCAEPCKNSWCPAKED